MKKRKLTLCIALLCVVVGGGAAAFWPRAGINRATALRIEKGMPLEQVEKLIGSPPGDYTTGLNPAAFGGVQIYEVLVGAEFETITSLELPISLWTCDTASIAVTPDAHGKVKQVSYAATDETWVQKVRRVLRLY